MAGLTKPMLKREAGEHFQPGMQGGVLRGPTC